MLITTATLAQRAVGPANPPVTGIIKAYDARTPVIDARGVSASVLVAPNARISVNVPKTLADIKPGDFIASGGKRGPDGKLRANEIRIF